MENKIKKEEKNFLIKTKNWLSDKWNDLKIWWRWNKDIVGVLSLFVIVPSILIFVVLIIFSLYESNYNDRNKYNTMGKFLKSE